MTADFKAFGGRLFDDLCSIVSVAAAAILRARARALDPRTKADRSPVTAADLAAQSVILEGLARILPGLPIVSEEGPVPATLPSTFALLDPLDGTRELIAGRDEFTINVAIIAGDRPRLGIVAAPALGLLWRGMEGAGAERLRLEAGTPVAAAHERKTIHTRPCPLTGLVAAVSRSHLDPGTVRLLGRLPIAEQLQCGSAVKFCQLAEGRADIYPRLSTTCEWDVAAGHAVLAAAGGTVLTPEGGALAYGRWGAGFRVPAFVAWGDPAAPTRFKL